ncbi:signal transduction protein [Kalymmatonema gypsitolerans NIES-4073]|nr:signal transduction protein [Scytonema sp. NIES-4073]
MTSVNFEENALSEQEVEKLWEAFKVFDEDGSGAISAEELGQIMRSLGQSPNDTDLRDMIKEVDVDLSGSINFEEFKALMVSRQGDRRLRHSALPNRSKPSRHQ